MPWCHKSAQVLPVAPVAELGNQATIPLETVCPAFTVQADRGATPPAAQVRFESPSSAIARPAHRASAWVESAAL